MANQVFESAYAKRAMRSQAQRLQMVESVLKGKNKEFNYEKKLATAMCLENTQRQIRVMESVNAGATQPSNIGQYKRYAIDMVTALVPNLIASDIVSTQALDNRVGMVNIFEYQYASNKGATAAGHVFNSPLGYDVDKNYATSLVADENVEADADGKFFTQYAPILGKVLDQQGQEVQVLDAENGELAAGGIVTYRYDNETVPVNAPEIKLNIKSLPVETRSRKLKAVWAFDAAYELNKEYGQDMQQLLATQAVGEIQAEIDNEITSDLYRIANAGPEVTWSRTAPLGVGTVEHYDSFWLKLIEGSNQIFGATKRAHANFMICGLNVDSVVKGMRNFQSQEDLGAVGPHKIGTLGNMNVYVNPFFDPDVFVLGYKGSTMLDAGYVYCPYMPILTTAMLQDANTFDTRQGWACMDGKKAINPRMYVRGRIIA